MRSSFPLRPDARPSACWRGCLAICLLLLAAPTLVAAEVWPDECMAGLFRCHADFSLAPHRALVGEMALLQKDIAATLGVAEAREPVHLFLFQEKETYQQYMKLYFPKVPYRRALFIKGRGPGMVFAYRGLDFEVDVRHESTHALLHASVRNVPLWLDEGLAEYFEEARERRADENPHLAAVRARVGIGQLPELERLESLTDFDDMQRDEYRDSWAWVHFMLHGPAAAREELQGYLADLEAGRPVEPLSVRLRRRLPDLNARLSAHFQR